MSPIDHETIQTKLLRLEKNITFLDGYCAISQVDFLNDHTIQGAVLHYLVESIEIIVDIGNHLLAQQGESSATYRDVILYLGKHNIIPTEFAQAHADMAQFRNLVVHVYDTIDLEEVYKTLQEAVPTFTKFAEYFQAFFKQPHSLDT